MGVSLSQDLWDDELELIIAASADRVLVRETYLPPNMDLGKAKRWFFGQKWAHFVLLDEKPVGMVVFHPKPGKFSTVEVETWVVEPFRGCGISQQAHPLVVEEAKKQWHYLTAWVWEDNFGSLGLVGHTKFERTGVEYVQDGRKCFELRLKLRDG